MKKIVFGLDFGTSNSALSVCINGKVEVLDVDQFNTNGSTLKSVIYFDSHIKDFFVGQQAVNQYLKNDAEGRYVQSVKSFLPSRAFDNTYIGGKNYELDELIAIILREIKERGEKIIQQKYGKNNKEISVKDVVLGRPVCFSEDRELDFLAQARLYSAAKIAGFENVQFQMEPIAAAYTYEEKLIEGEKKTILVGDFGGGTSDFTIAKLQGRKSNKPLEREKIILSTRGVYIGGDTFDSKIMKEKITKYFGKFVKLQTMESMIDKGSARDSISPKLFKNLCKWEKIPLMNNFAVMQELKQYQNLACSKDFVKEKIKMFENFLLENPLIIKKAESIIDELKLFLDNNNYEQCKKPINKLKNILEIERSSRIKNEIENFEKLIIGYSNINWKLKLTNMREIIRYEHKLNREKAESIIDELKLFLDNNNYEQCKKPINKLKNILEIERSSRIKNEIENFEKLIIKYSNTNWEFKLANIREIVISEYKLQREALVKNLSHIIVDKDSVFDTQLSQIKRLHDYIIEKKYHTKKKILDTFIKEKNYAKWRKFIKTLDGFNEDKYGYKLFLSIEKGNQNEQDNSPWSIMDIWQEKIEKISEYLEEDDLGWRKEISDLEILIEKKDYYGWKEQIANLGNLIEHNYGYMLFQSIEKAKCELSSIPQTKILFSGYDLHISEEIQRIFFEEIIKEEIKKIKACIETMLIDADLEDKDIDIVLLTGGSSFIPCIRKYFETKFGKEKVKMTDAFTSVVYGLGVYAGRL